MDKEKLIQHLFSKVSRVFVILDGALIPELRMKIYEMKPVHHCLFTGELEPDMAEVAPYMVRLIPNTHFTEWVLSECWGKNWGIFAQTRETVIEMRKHFSSLITVYDESGAPMTFRYYDPRVWRKFLPTCQPDELKTIFGKVDAFFVESEDQESFIRYELNKEGVKETPLQ
jgi:hypothetical protein